MTKNTFLVVLTVIFLDKAVSKHFDTFSVRRNSSFLVNFEQELSGDINSSECSRIKLMFMSGPEG